MPCRKMPFAVLAAFAVLAFAISPALAKQEKRTAKKRWRVTSCGSLIDNRNGLE